MYFSECLNEITFGKSLRNTIFHNITSIKECFQIGTDYQNCCTLALHYSDVKITCTNSTVFANKKALFFPLVCKCDINFGF